MKIIKFVFFCFLSFVLVACFGIFILFQTFDTSRYLPDITKKASLFLGRSITIGHVGLGVTFRGFTLDASPVTIADDAAFTDQPFIKIDRIRVTLDLKSLILRRAINITEILLQSPQIHFIRSLDGNINSRSIGTTNKLATESSFPMGGRDLGRSNSQVLEGMRNVVPYGEMDLCVFCSGKSQAKIERHLFFKSIRIQDASISFIDQNQSFPLDVWLTGINADLNISSFSKPIQFLLDASLYSNIPNVHARAMVSLNLSQRLIQYSDLNLGIDLSHVNIDALKGVSPEMSDNPILKNFTGMVQLNMPHLDIGPVGYLEGNGDISITGGAIKNFNIVKAVLSRTLGVFGGLDSIIDKVATDDTIVEKAQAKFSLHDKTVFIDDSLIKTNILEFSAQGSVDQGLNMDMQTMLHLNSDVSASLVNELEGLKLLYDDSNRISIGASLKGVFPHLKYKPNKDFRKKSKKVLMQEGGNILGLFLGGESVSVQPQDQSSQESGKKHKKNFKNLFKGLFQ